MIIPNARGSTLDPCTNQETGLTTKLGIDAPCPLTKPQEKFERAKIPTSKGIAETIEEMRKA
jgi:2,5-furandicarboxylate decarboxylase 1